ncbi:MAG TPA: AI-2E family transporter, partial [Tepidisphaeraceae bacterium]|nr:AI-2E family transporter [Tepidisphaeraceae bacterium]
MSDSRSRGTLWGVALTIGLVLLFAYPLRFVLLPFVGAGALAYLARPIVHWLPRKFGLPRWLAALVAYLLFLVICAVLAWAVQRLAVPQIDAMMTNSEATIQKFVVTVFHGKQIP